MSIWKTCEDILFQGLLEVRKDVEVVEQIQCPHDLGGCGRFIDRQSGTQLYFDPQTKKYLLKPTQVVCITAICAFIAVVMLSGVSLRILGNSNILFTSILGFFLWGIISILSLIKREQVLSRADHIEIYHCPNPACGLRSTFMNGKPIRPK